LIFQRKGIKFSQIKRQKNKCKINLLKRSVSMKEKLMVLREAKNLMFEMRHKGGV
jgi:hypothetical protein